MKYRINGTTGTIEAPQTIKDMEILMLVHTVTTGKRIRTAISNLFIALRNDRGYVIVQDKAYAVDNYGNVQHTMTLDAYHTELLEKAGREMAASATVGDFVRFEDNGKTVFGTYRRHEEDKGIVVMADNQMYGVLFKDIKRIRKPEPDNGIISTPKTPQPFIIREEPHPLAAGLTVFRVYRADSSPLYIGDTSIEKAEAALRTSELVSSITIEYQATITVDFNGHVYTNHGRFIEIDETSDLATLHEADKAFPTQYQLFFVQSIIADNGAILYKKPSEALTVVDCIGSPLAWIAVTANDKEYLIDADTYQQHRARQEKLLGKKFSLRAFERSYWKADTEGVVVGTQENADAMLEEQRKRNYFPYASV